MPKVAPWAVMSLLGGYIGGWFSKENHTNHEICRDPGPVIERAAKTTADPAKIFSAVAVQSINRSGLLGMAGAAITDTVTPIERATRRTVIANVYSRIAAGSTVMAFREQGSHTQILLVKNKRKLGKLLPSQGYGKFGPVKHTGEHFSDFDSKGMDAAEELILKGHPVDEAYKIVSESEDGRGQRKSHPYGSFDIDFLATAKREFKEEIGITLEDLKYIGQEITYRSGWGLHTCDSTFLTVLAGDAERFFSPDEDEIESIHMINLEDIFIQPDGSGKIKGFDEIIPADYVKRIEKAVIAYEEIQLEKISYGFVTSISQLQKYLELNGAESPKFIPIGPGRSVSSQELRVIAASISISLKKVKFPFFEGTKGSRTYSSPALEE